MTPPHGFEQASSTQKQIKKISTFEVTFLPFQEIGLTHVWMSTRNAQQLGFMNPGARDAEAERKSRTFPTWQ